MVRFTCVMKNTLIILLLASTAVAQTPDSQAPKPDNTRKNAAEQTTAENQGGSPEDREITKNIRRSIVKTDALSSMAKNIKVITINKNVTLRGPVRSEQEKATIGSLAEQAAGQGKVANHLEVKKSE